MQIDELSFKDGLIPAIVQDQETDEVLMLAYMSKESLKKTMETGRTWFFSRKRRRLWPKGETSGNIQKVSAIYYDCDKDTLLLKVHQHGFACHRGTKSCFVETLFAKDEEKDDKRED
jgi:phosphoribosyl-ATP pyrophosphohydrolase/phosphoribosyl-AMP cyclohydrolase